jgi:hypothetical protein
MIEWHKKSSGIHRSAAGDNYRVHFSGKESITAYQFSPFLPLGTHKSWKIAMDACQTHHDNKESNNGTHI